MSREALIFGATRGVGLRISRLLAEAGFRVVALVRASSEASELQATGAEIVKGDANDAAAVNEAFSKVGSDALVISTLGGKGADGVRVDDIGNILVIDRAHSAQVSSFVLVTSLGCGEMRPFMSERALEAFGDSLLAKTRAEEHLRATALPWRIIRPGGLLDDPGTGQGRLYEHHDIHGLVTRDEVARLVIDAANNPRTLHKVLVALDADRIRGDGPHPAPF